MSRMLQRGLPAGRLAAVTWTPSLGAWREEFAVPAYTEAVNQADAALGQQFIYMPTLLQHVTPQYPDLRTWRMVCLVGTSAYLMLGLICMSPDMR